MSEPGGVPSSGASWEGAAASGLADGVFICCERASSACMSLTACSTCSPACSTGPLLSQPFTASRDVSNASTPYEACQAWVRFEFSGAAACSLVPAPAPLQTNNNKNTTKRKNKNRSKKKHQVAAETAAPAAAGLIPTAINS